MNNQEILFLYDAKLANPNGDPDDENRPRMDYMASRNLVSDVRLKRYIRNFLQDKGHQVFVENREDGKVVDASTRLTGIVGHEPSWNDLEMLKTTLTDIRLFGATMPIKNKEKGKGDSIKITGPVQFTWGYSLNKAELVDTYSITSSFSSKEDKKQGTFGKDYRVYYSLVSFYGVVSGHRADNSGMTDPDCELLDEAMLRAIPQQATRSKVGQFPRMYMRIEYNDKETVLGDWREYISMDKTSDLRSVSDFSLELSGLVEVIKKNSGKISRVLLWINEGLNITLNGSRTSFDGILDSLSGINVEHVNV